MQTTPFESADFWYALQPERLHAEKQLMERFFPKFELQTLSDGRLAWFGSLNTGIIPTHGGYHIQIVYEHHFGTELTSDDQIKGYLVGPTTLDELQQLLREEGSPERELPHSQADVDGRTYLSEGREVRLKHPKYLKGSITAVTNITYFYRWLTLLEVWLAGDLKLRDFYDFRF